MKGVGYGFLSGLLIVAMLLQPWPSIARFRALAGDGIRQVDSGLHPNQAAQDASVFLPFVINPLGPPQFDIVNPGGGWTISGTLYFAVQPINPAAFSSVTFKAGSTVLGVDATPEDGFRVFLDAKTLPAGTLELSAIATGPAGETTKSITVNVVPNPPSTGTLGSQGGVLASEIGSIITIPPGAVPDGTNVSVLEKTQEQVTADNGIDWEALGVTFLGAQDIQSTAQFSKPLGVSSAGFGNRVQPGQVVVNYRIMPDANGDGTDEIVVVNAASVAPNNDIVSGPVPQILVRSLNVQLNAKNASLDKLADEISGPPGTLVEIRASGFNPASINGNIAIWTSSVDEQVFELPGLVQPDPASSSDQIFTAVIPPLVPGGATLTLRNESTGATAGPIDVTIATPSPLSKPATEIIDQFWADTIQYLQGVPTLSPDETTAVNAAIDQFTRAQNDFQQLVDNGLTPELEQGLDSIALTIANSTIYSVQTNQATFVVVQGGYDADAKFGDFLGFMGGVVGIVGGVAGGVAASTALAGVAAGAGIGLGILAAGYFACKLIRGGSCFGNPPSNPPDSPVCSPSQSGAGPGTTGMGSAPPPGGSGCGNSANNDVGGLLTGASASVADQAGRVIVKLFSSGSPMAFSGMTDPGGYFFIPLIPEGEPFTALAIDTANGDTRTFEGTGPAMGDSILMFFDFVNEDTSGATPIQIGEVVTGAITATGQVDLYGFPADTGQAVFFDGQTPGPSSIRWAASDRTGVELFSASVSANRGPFVLAQGGTHIITVKGSTTEITGTYQFQVWDVPDPDEFAISIGDTVSNGVPGPGAGNIETPAVKDIYTFSATAGQEVFFELLDRQGLVQTDWRLQDPSGDVIFQESMYTDNTGPYVLTSGGTYTLTVGLDEEWGETGTYQFKLWNVPAPDEFAISIGDTISDGVPGAGAGNIETPAVKDIYTFSAAAGQEVFFELLDRQGLVQTDWRLQDPSGDVIFQESMYTDNTGPYVLTSGGTYTLTVGLDEEWGETGTYQFKLWNVPAPDEFVISIGDTISDGVPGPGAGNIETPAVKDIYTFSATAGQEILLDLLDHQGLTQTDWRLQDPSGNAIFQSSMFNGDEGPYALTTSGTFTITVGLDAEWSETGTYQFQLQACPCP